MDALEDRTKLIGSGTVDGLIAFADYLSDKGYASSAATNPWKSAARQVFNTVDGTNFGGVDLRSLDIDDYLARFETMTRGKYKAESIAAYRARLRRALDAYLGYLETGQPPQLRAGVPKRRGASAGGTASGNGTTSPPLQSGGHGGTAAPPIDLVDYPFPLRSGQLAYVRLPRRLDRTDAERLAAFVRTLVFEPQKELAAGDAEES